MWTCDLGFPFSILDVVIGRHRSRALVLPLLVPCTDLNLSPSVSLHMYVEARKPCVRSLVFVVPTNGSCRFLRLVGPVFVPGGGALPWDLMSFSEMLELMFFFLLAPRAGTGPTYWRFFRLVGLDRTLICCCFLLYVCILVYSSMLGFHSWEKTNI